MIHSARASPLQIEVSASDQLVLHTENGSQRSTASVPMLSCKNIIEMTPLRHQIFVKKSERWYKCKSNLLAHCRARSSIKECNGVGTFLSCCRSSCDHGVKPS